MPDTPPPSIGRRTGRISTNATSRRRNDGGRRAPEPIRSGRGGAGLGWGGAGTLPRVGEGAVRKDLPNDRGIVQRGDQAQPAPTMATGQDIHRERPVHEGRPAPGARTALHPGTVRICGERRRQGRGLGRHASVSDNSLAPAGARSQDAMADEQVRFRPGCHRRQPLQEFQRLEHQLARAVVPRRLQLERDAAVAPQPQALLREGRTQDIAALCGPGSYADLWDHFVVAFMG